MVSSKKTKLYIVAFLLMIVAAALSHALMRSYYLTSAIGTVLYMVIIGAWSFTIRRRILDERCRSILSWLCYGMMLWLLLRMCKSDLIYSPAASRFCWYLYYIPMTVLPYLIFYISILVQRPEEEAVPDWIKRLGFGIVPLTLLVLTNDFHQMTFRFPVPLSNWKENMPYHYGPFYYLIVLWMILNGVAALLILAQKKRLSQTRRLAWLPILPVVVGVVLLLLYAIGMIPAVMGRQPFQIQEVICLMCIGFLEGCIQIGMIPSNEGYEMLFAQSSIAAQVLDEAGNAIYTSKQSMDIEENIFERLLQDKVLIDGDRRFSSVPLQGGYFVWSDDLATIHQINEDLMETVEVITGENAIIEEENKLKEDDARYKTMNRLYDEIALLVRPQVLLIEELLDRDDLSEEEFRQNISYAAFYNAYIKRRSNLVLLAERDEMLDMEELYLSCAESMQFLTLCGKTAYIEPFQDQTTVDKSIVFDAYDFFEHIIEANIHKIDAMMVTMRVSQEMISFRITFDVQEEIKVLPDTIAKISREQDDQMLALTLLYTRGGVSK